MKDIEIAKKYLNEENLTIAVVKSKKLIFKSKEKGIKPIYKLAKEMKEIAKDGVLADKVIGKGAALLCKYIGIKEVYGELISESAIKLLEDENIKFSYLNTTEYIKNRDKTGLCPIENMAMNIEDGEILLERIEAFLGE
jgi:tyrosine-protein phosphatase YwqE